MEIIQALQRLTAIDQEWDEKARRFQEVRHRLTDATELATMRKEQEAREKTLSEMRATLRNLELELQSLQQRAKQVEEDLYGGGIVSPRELENLRRDGEHLSRRVEQLEDEAIETMTVLDRLEEEASVAGDALEEFERDWAEDTVEFREEYEVLRKRLQELKAERERLRAQVPGRELALYDELYRTKGGRPLAPVQAGSCQVCHVSVPSNKRTIAAGGQGTVATCEGCGRILYLP